MHSKQERKNKNKYYSTKTTFLKAEIWCTAHFFFILSTVFYKYKCLYYFYLTYDYDQLNKLLPVISDELNRTLKLLKKNKLIITIKIRII